VYPGYVYIIGNSEGILASGAHGNLTYGIPPPYRPDGTSFSPPMTMGTKFDMASLTKIYATSLAAISLY